jgi:hypothetical protein
MFDDDDFFLGFMLPWPAALLLLIIMGIYALWYWQLPTSEKQVICTKEAAPFKVESKYDPELGCIVKIDASHWQKIEKYRKSGVIEMK